MALNWLLHDDPKQRDVTEAKLQQRFILALLVFEFGGPADWLSEEDECEWNGVSCKGEVKVIKLDLCKFQLVLNVPFDSSCSIRIH